MDFSGFSNATDGLLIVKKAALRPAHARTRGLSVARASIAKISAARRDVRVARVFLFVRLLMAMELFFFFYFGKFNSCPALPCPALPCPTPPVCVCVCVWMAGISLAANGPGQRLWAPPNEPDGTKKNE